MSDILRDLKLDRAQERLISTLFEESACYASLIELAHTELVALRSGDADGVEQLLGKKDHLIRQVGRLEAERMAMAAELAPRVGEDPATATLSSLKPAFPEAAQEMLTELQEMLREHATELAAANRKNAALLETSLRLLGRWISFLVRPAASATTYSPEGAGAANRQIRTLDSKA